MTLAQWFNVVTLLLAASFAVTLVPVCVMYAMQLDAGPRVAEELPTVLRVTAVFIGWSLLAGTAWHAHRRQWPGAPWLQLASYTATAGACALLYVLLI